MKNLFTFFSDDFQYALGWTVIHSLWQATVIAIIAGVAMIFLRKKSAELRYIVYNVALFAVLLSAIITFNLYLKNDSIARLIAPNNSTELNAISVSVQAGKDAQDMLQNIEVQSVDNDNSLLVVHSKMRIPLSMAGMKTYFDENIYLIVLLWLMGVGLFLLKLLGGISYVYYLRTRLNFPADEYWLEMVDQLSEKIGIKQSIELVESALVRTPLVIGHAKPMILFPIGAINKLSPNEVEAILAHEIAHIMRNDYVFNIIQSIIEALFYFHPAVWWMSANIRTERENCCDDIAIALCGNSMTYAKALVSLQEIAFFHSPQLAMALAGKNKNQLLIRVQRILNQPRNKTNIMEKLVATCFLVIMIGVLSFGGNYFNNNLSAIGDSSSSIDVEVTNNKEPNLSISSYLKYFNNGQLDSFPVSKDIKNGEYNYADNVFKATLLVKDHAVTKLNINGSEIATSEIKNHVGFINKIIKGNTTTPQYNEMSLYNNIPQTPVSLPTVPTPPTSPVINEGNNDRLFSNPDGSETTVSYPPTENDVLLISTTKKDGSRKVVRTNKNGTLINEEYDKEGKKTTQLTSKNTSNTVVINDDGGSQTIRSNGEIETIHPDGSRELLRGQTGEIIQYDRNGKVTSYLSGNGSKKLNGAKSDIISKGKTYDEDYYQDLGEDISDFKDDIKDDDCVSNRPIKYKIMLQLSILKGKLRKGLTNEKLELFEHEFEQLRQNWENKPDCNDESK